MYAPGSSEYPKYAPESYCPSTVHLGGTGQFDMGLAQGEKWPSQAGSGTAGAVLTVHFTVHFSFENYGMDGFGRNNGLSGKRASACRVSGCS